jgi:NADH:ubiquinone oxidoreductase subunit D
VNVVDRQGGDCYARSQVRFGEMRESIRIVARAIVDGMPEGPINGASPSSCRADQDTAGQVYVGIETPRGELGTWSSPTATRGRTPYRLKIRPPSLHALSALPYILPGAR